MSEKRILMVDDDESFAQAVTICLKSKGYQVSYARNKVEGRQKIEETVPDLVILDVMMDKVCDGFDLARELRGNLKFNKIKILMFTAIGDELGFKYSPGAGDGRWLPVDDYAEKSIDMEALSAKVKILLER